MVSADSFRLLGINTGSSALCRGDERLLHAPSPAGSPTARTPISSAARASCSLAQTLFEPDAPASVLLVHGPAGIGKSVLAREIARRGWASDERPLLVIDDHEQRRRAPRCRPSSPGCPRTPVVGDREPRAVRRGMVHRRLGDRLVLELELRPLSSTTSARSDMLQRLGTGDDHGARARSCSGPAGMPLALRLAAGAARTDPAWRPGRPAPALRHLGAVADRPGRRSATRCAALHLPHIVTP